MEAGRTSYVSAPSSKSVNLLSNHEFQIRSRIKTFSDSLFTRAEAQIELPTRETSKLLVNTQSLISLLSRRIRQAARSAKIAPFHQKLPGQKAILQSLLCFPYYPWWGAIPIPVAAIELGSNHSEKNIWFLMRRTSPYIWYKKYNIYSWINLYIYTLWK